ncbi:MAG: hypothetical protein EB003_08060 [Flavobacteriia bacterium]|nr:hypothetical protein [Flavobacteriia bacterium]
MQQANNEYKINYSRERGLMPILMFVEDLINCDILPAIDKTLGDKYKFVFTGLTDETPQNEIAQMQAEMSVWKSMNDLLQQAQKDKKSRQEVRSIRMIKSLVRTIISSQKPFRN